MTPGADGQLRFHVRDAAGNVIWPAVTRVGDGPYYEFNDTPGGRLHEDMVSLSGLTFVEDWWAPPYDPKELKSVEHADVIKDGTTSDGQRLTEIISFKCAPETKRGMLSAASDKGLDTSRWLRRLVSDELALLHAGTQNAIPVWASEGALAVSLRYRNILVCADCLAVRCAAASDLSLFLHAFTAQWTRLSDRRSDFTVVLNTLTQVTALWTRLAKELYGLWTKLDRPEDRAALMQIGKMMNATRAELNAFARDLRELVSKC